MCVRVIAIMFVYLFISEIKCFVFFFYLFQLVVLFAALAAINAQWLQPQIPSITSQDQNIYRTLGNLGQVATHSKSINTPFSSVSKSDVRVSNPGIQGISYGGLGLGHGYNPYGIGAHGISPIGLGHPGISPLGLGGYQRVVPQIARPVGVIGGIGGIGVSPGLLGVAYSASPSVAHMTYSNGLGINYAW